MNDMKKFTDIVNHINESSSDNVFVIYLEDGTMYNYYNDEDEANKIAAELNKESKCNDAKVKSEPRTNFEKND